MTGGGGGLPWRRREMLAALAALPLAGCEDRAPETTGALIGADAERGHLLRQQRTWPLPGARGRVRVLIAGGGIAGLAAARALRQRGIEDFALLELEDAVGGNSRGGQIAGIACPLGAHYLPVPGDSARDVQDFLEETGVRKRVAGRWTYDEKVLCHAPQERLYFRGQWQEGLLPLHDVGPHTLSEYRRFADLVAAAQREARFSMPAPLQPPAAHRRLDTHTFANWLEGNAFTDPHLRWYLDYCCRDDYGAGIGVVSAWAGLHYFASRHGFHTPASPDAERDAVLTWPEGNAWLTRQLAEGLGDRVRTGHVVFRIQQNRRTVEVDTWNTANQSVERWTADRCIVALPLFVAARVVQNAPAIIRNRAQRTRYAPWAVANLHVREPLRDRPGAPPAWDNVIHGARGLGYVDARHQTLDPRPGPTVLSWYSAPGEHARAMLLNRGWREWMIDVVAELAAPHPDLAGKLSRIEVARYGHAMAIPAPGTLAQVAAGLPRGRISYAHADLAGYSVFEEAFTAGHRAGLQAG